ncbi:3-hydroxyacyl-CoA dehydrogenase NAD-binding domain-containing protein [Aliiglaciecola sp. LCG003]|uniref:3-hydroxyacyl-CoA dehydrogenase NAD-binding domain-containing protein n=1 Tax=Aliiglaciecola sp. LCG003 TaxID=3053655 RepID=UPI002573C386|nr:3-hydroxyacyl-CoA dehydrogenase NAD-binding domain-containing protein [Aliiglaciecola sp. LCG003]WJG10658.1 3-hydroxyacyl-CoA dehydrogenase NAD-binding domain-containing protein [Aliiglaciecola sp. LCG003]
MQVIQYQKDQKNIVHLIFDRPECSANLMDARFADDFAQAITTLLKDEYAGVILRSAKSTFFSGGDLTMLSQVSEENAGELFHMLEKIKASMRALETCGKPVVACINGAALGGGWELALGCHHRIALEHPALKMGLPEVTLGLLPGGGGVTRMVRLLGLEGALPYLTEGKQFNSAAGLKAGLIHAVAQSQEQMLDMAQDWIFSHPKVCQPWDEKSYKIPGGTPSHPKVAQTLAILPAMLRAKTKGVLPAPESIVSAMVEGAQVDFDTATRIESRYFVELACGQVAKNMINTFWFQLNQIKAGSSRPSNIDKHKVQKVAVLGAGMMGAGIAFACAIKGIPVILKDTDTKRAEHGKDYSRKLLDKQLRSGRKTAEQIEQVLGLITPSADVADLADCDLVIEAVFEDRALKARVTQEAEAVLGKGALFASNTSTLPITGLAKASSRPANFAGLHFFSPVDKMPLVEIICGQQTSDESLARCFDFVQQIGKTPIVVNDSRGFFTSRVFEKFVGEGMAMLGEGVPAASIENAAYLAGFPVGPLAVTDEVSLTLIDKIKRQNIADFNAEGKQYPGHPSDKVVDRMLELERPGKVAQAGFYDYPSQGGKHLWTGLSQFTKSDLQVPLQDIKERLLFIMAIETVRCLQEHVLTSSVDANIGSIFGIGYPPWTGGCIQFINQYGIASFIRRAQQFCDTYGERFAPPQLLIDKAQLGESL